MARIRTNTLFKLARSSVLHLKRLGTFIDYGAGLGRVVALAARERGYSAVIGIELSADLARRGNENLSRARYRTPCLILCIDASDFSSASPCDDILFLQLVYRINPCCCAATDPPVLS